MAYTITLNGYGEYKEWQEVNLKTPEMYFAMEQEAEETARDMDNLAWEAWDKNHPDADEEEKLRAADPAPAFEVTECAAVQNINSAFGDAVCFGSVDEMTEAIQACGYELPEDGLVEGRDYQEV